MPTNTSAAVCPMCGHVNEPAAAARVHDDGAGPVFEARCTQCGERFRYTAMRETPVKTSAWEATLAAALLAAIALGFVLALLFLGVE